MSIVFQYSTTDTTLSTTSPVLKVDDLAPTSVVKATGSLWNITYSWNDLQQKASRIQALHSLFCTSPQNSAYNQSTFAQLRIDFCIQPETYPSLYCPAITDYNKLGTNTCSRLYSTNNDFNNDKISNKIQCSGLVPYLDVSNTDSTMKTAVQNGYKTFCAANPTMRECQCYNRANFEAYKNTKEVLSSGGSMQSGNESCWYIPCQYQTNITVDPDIQNAYGKIECPSVCQNIVAAINVKNVVLSDISLSNNCFGTGSGTVKTDISSDATKKTVSDTNALFNSTKIPTTTTQASPYTLSVGAIIGLVVAAFVVLVVVLVVVFSRKSKGDGGTPLLGGGRKSA
jgi:hypothetical protein